MPGCAPPIAAVPVVTPHLRLTGDTPEANFTVGCATADDEFAAVAQHVGELPALVGFVRRRFPDLASEAEDIVQDTFVAVRHRIAHVDNPVAYLYEVARRRAYTVWNKRNRVVLASDGYDECLRIQAAVDPAPTAARTVDFDAFVRTLPRQEQRVAVCQYVYRMTVSEIAKAMNVKEGTVKSWQNRIRNRARAMYGEAKVVSA
ncbi:hypothetical protein GCM10023205_25420 [Yinghuangia aomiensis]|uniref:RNA polymerase sigma-70 factor, ECF subfamily n=1 Tax=Yinghuangia aomiensis TaxID=676205 RepID=A0ABP9H336_9ACTN